MDRGFKTKLIVNNKEATTLKHYCDVARFVFNWALADRKTAYEDRGEYITDLAPRVLPCFSGESASQARGLIDDKYAYGERLVVSHHKRRLKWHQEKQLD